MSESASHEAAPLSWRGVFRHLGPGLIVTAAIVGSGELIVTPKLGAKVGFDLLWFVIIACILKVFVQIELGRLAILRGKSTLSVMNDMPGPKPLVSWLVWFCLLMYLAIIVQISGILGGCAQVFANLFPGLLSEWIWVLLTTSLALLLLISGKYKMVESSSTIMVFLFTLTTLFAVIALSQTEYAITTSNVASGLSFTLPDSFTTAFAVFGVTGVGASELIFYPYWCLEKGYAKKAGDRSSDGFADRAKGWMRVMRLDATLSLIVYTIATAAFYMLGAAVLHAKSLEVKNEEMLATLSKMYEESFGALGLWIFLIGAFFVLFSTFYVSAASIARIFTDAAGLFQKDSSLDKEKMTWRLSIAIPVVCSVIYLSSGSPVSLVLIGAFAQGLMLPFLGVMALYFHYQEPDKSLRSSGLFMIFLWISALLITSIGLYQAWDKLKALF